MLYVYDGTKSGFLTAFLAAFSDNEARISSKTTQLALGETPVFVPTDEDKAQRVCARFRSFDSYCLRDLDFLLRSGQEDSEAVTFAYFKTLAQYKRPIRHQLTLPGIIFASTAKMPITDKVKNKEDLYYGLRFAALQRS